MNKTATVLLLAASALVILLPQSDAQKIYKDFISISSRVPGDELILHSSSQATQKLDFLAKVTIQVRYPENLPHSNFTISHILFTGRDNTGYIDIKFDQGGPGQDFMLMKLILESVKNGKYDLFVYGKKK